MASKSRQSNQKIVTSIDGISVLVFGYSVATKMGTLMKAKEEFKLLSTQFEAEWDRVSQIL